MKDVVVDSYTQLENAEKIMREYQNTPDDEKQEYVENLFKKDHPTHPHQPACAWTHLTRQYENFVKTANSSQMKKERIIKKVEKEFSMVSKASTLIGYLFANVKDKAGEPYIEHCLRVANPLQKEADVDMYVAALLHDVVGDSDFTIDDIELIFNKNIAQTVDHLTKREGESYSQRTRRLLQSGDIRAIKIKLSDLHDNMNMLRLDVENLTQKDIDRLEKYQRTYFKIIQFLNNVL